MPILNYLIEALRNQDQFVFSYGEIIRCFKKEFGTKYAVGKELLERLVEEKKITVERIYNPKGRTVTLYICYPVCDLLYKLHNWINDSFFLWQKIIDSSIKKEILRRSGIL